MKRFIFLIITLPLFLTFMGCQQESDSQNTGELLAGEEIQVEGAWARPGGEGQMSASYFLISNYGNEDDKLISVQSDVAQNVEVHESYEREEGMMGMREVTNLELPRQSTVRFEQGGLHIMLMQLNRQLEDGDSFELELSFQNSDPITIEVPVRL